MRQSIGWGIAVGTCVALVAWFGEPLESGVSLFPDLFSLVVFASLATFAFDRLLRRTNRWKEAISAVAAFGVAAGLVLGIATLHRGATVWSRISLPLTAATLLGSLAIVILLSCSIGFLTFYSKTRRARVSA